MIPAGLTLNSELAIRDAENRAAALAKGNAAKMSRRSKPATGLLGEIEELPVPVDRGPENVMGFDREEIERRRQQSATYLSDAAAKFKADVQIMRERGRQAAGLPATTTAAPTPPAD